MNLEILNKAIFYIKKENLKEIFIKYISIVENNTDLYPLAFNYKTNELFFLIDCKNGNNWDKIENKIHSYFFIIGWVSQKDILLNDFIDDMLFNLQEMINQL